MYCTVFLRLQWTEMRGFFVDDRLIVFSVFPICLYMYAEWQSSTFSVKNSCSIPVTFLVILKKNIISNVSHLLGNISFRQYVLQNSSGFLIWKEDDSIKFQLSVLVIIPYENALITNIAFRQYQLIQRYFLQNTLGIPIWKADGFALCMYLLVFQSAYLCS